MGRIFLGEIIVFMASAVLCGHLICEFPFEFYCRTISDEDLRVQGIEASFENFLQTCGHLWQQKQKPQVYAELPIAENSKIFFWIERYLRGAAVPTLARHFNARASTPPRLLRRQSRQAMKPRSIEDSTTCSSIWTTQANITIGTGLPGGGVWLCSSGAAFLGFYARPQGLFWPVCLDRCARPSGHVLYLKKIFRT